MTELWSAETGPDDGTVVVLVHGSMDRSTGMLALARQLDHRWRVVRYDRRGYARSSHDGPFGVADQVADLWRIVGDRRVVLFGHSYGGNVVLAASIERPEQVAGVAVYETPTPWVDWWPQRSAALQAVWSTDPSAAGEAFMRRLIGDARWEALPERTRATRRAEGRVMVAELADLRRRAPWQPDRVTVPVVAGFGSLGAPHHRDAMTRLAAEVQDAQAVELDGCGHDAPTAHAAVVAERLITPFEKAV